VNTTLFFVTLLVVFISKNDIKPHYSYLIEKQKEMLRKHINNRDLRVLETPEYAGMPI